MAKYWVAEAGARVVAARVDARGDLDLDDFRSKLGPRTKMVSVSHVSNVLGTINPVSDLIALAREHGVPVMIDGESLRLTPQRANVLPQAISVQL